MNPLLVASIVSRLIACGWSLVLLRKTRDWRIAFLTGMLFLMTVRAIVHAATGHAAEWTGWQAWSYLGVGIAAIFALAALSRFVGGRERVIGQLGRDYQALAGLLDKVIFVQLDMQGVIVRVNPATERVTGYRQSELIGKNWFELIVPKARFPKVHESFTTIPRRGGVTRDDENPIVTRSGEERYIIWQNSSLREGDAIVGTVSFGLDVTEQKLAEGRLRESERRLATVISNLPGAVYRCRNDENWTTDFASDGMLELTGYPADDFVEQRRHMGQLIHPDDHGRVWNEVQAALAARHPYELTYRIVAASGREKWVWERGRGVYAADGSLLALEGFGTDITERVQTEHKLRESEARLRLAATAANVGFWDWDLTTNAIYYSPEWKSQLGYREDEISDQFSEWQSRVHAEDLEPTLQRIRAYVANPRGRFEAEFRLRSKDGSYRWVFSVADVLRDDQGQPCRMLGCHVDITERKAVEAVLRESEERLRLFIEHAPAAIAMFDRDMRYLAASCRWITDYRLGDEDIIGRSHYEVFPEMPERWKEIHRRCLAGAVERCEEEEFPRADGTLDWVRWEIRPWHTQQGDIGGVILFSEVITERKLAKEALGEAEARYRSLVERIPAITYVAALDDVGSTWYISPQIESLGFSQKEWLARPELWSEQIHPDDRERVLREYSRAASAGEPFRTEYRLLTRDGRIKWIRDESQIVRDPAGRPLFQQGIMVDTTERKTAERALAESEARLRRILDSVQAFIGLTTPEGVLLEVNRPALEQAGLRREEVVGKALVDTPWVSHSPAVRVQFADAIRRAAEGEVVREESSVLMAGGRVIISDFSMVGVRDAEGRIVQLIPSAVDITDRKQAEQALRDSRERLASLSRQLIEAHESERRNLARELHDQIGQVLTAVGISLQQVQAACPAANRARIENSLRMVRQAIEQVRSLSLNLRPTVLDDFGLVPALRWLLNRQNELGKTEIEFHEDTTGETLAPELCTACYRIVQEAVTNALRHSRARHVRVKLKQTGEAVRVSVEDDGVGFEVLGQAQRATDGRSFGLLSMQERANLLGGEFELHSFPGRGTTVVARFPVIDPAQASMGNQEAGES